MDIVEELRKDRENGAKRLVSEYKAGLMSLARRFYKNESDAEELVNATFAKVVANIDDYLEQSAFFAWMCQILTNEFRDSVKRKSNKVEVYPGTLPDIADEGAQEKIFCNLDHSLLRDAIETLPREMKEAIMLHYIAEQPVPVVARFLRLPISTVKWRLHVARKELARRLGAGVKDAVRKPSVKAILLALALCGLTALGAGAWSLVVSGESRVASRMSSSASAEAYQQTTSDPRQAEDYIATQSAADCSRPSATDQTFDFRLSTFDDFSGEQNMNISRTKRAAAMLAAATVATGAATTANAADYTWMGAPPNSLWDTGTRNWNSSEKWVDGNNAIFPSDSNRKTINVSGPRCAANVTVNGKSYTFQAYNNDSSASLEVTGTFTANESVTVTCPFAGESLRLGGATDKVLTLKASNSRQAATYLTGTPVVQATADGVFGPVPASPSDNIVVLSGMPILQLNKISELAANRSIRIESGAGLRLANETNNTPTVVRGVISGRPDATLGFVTNGCVTILRKWTWMPAIVFDPGAGRTNDVGRLEVSESNLRIASGTTRVGSPVNHMTSSSAPLYVHGKSGDNEFTDDWGNLVVDGGVLYASQASRYVDVRYYGQVAVTNDGGVFMPYVEWLNGHGSPGRLSVSNGGTFLVRTLRLSNASSVGTEVVLGENGLITVDSMGLCPPVSGYACRFLFDGGAVQSLNGREDFLRSTTLTALTDEDWNNVSFVVGGKGAVFDSTNGKDIHWSRPLVHDSNVAQDGGVCVKGADTSKGLVLSVANTYNGATVVENAKLDIRANDALPSGSVVRLAGGVMDANGTAQTLTRVEGSGSVSNGSSVSVNGSVAPSVDGMLSLQGCALSGTYEIRGDASGCGCISVAAGQNIAGLALAAADMAAMDAEAARGAYKILDAANGYSGQFSLAAGFPSDTWRVRYTATAAYLDSVSATVIIMR